MRWHLLSHNPRESLREGLRGDGWWDDLGLAWLRQGCLRQAVTSRPDLSTPPSTPKVAATLRTALAPPSGPDPPSLPQGSRLPARTSMKLLQSPPPPRSPQVLPFAQRNPIFLCDQLTSARPLFLQMEEATKAAGNRG